MARPEEMRLKQWTRQHRVTYEVSPHFEMQRHQKVTTGFDLTLHAARSGPCTSDPGCACCHAIHDGLGVLVRQVVPNGARYQVEAFDSSFHLRPETQWEPEIELVAEIQPRAGAFASVDDGDAAYLEAIREALGRLGAQLGKWKDG
jgi:hypothetical protein